MLLIFVFIGKMTLLDAYAAMSSKPVADCPLCSDCLPWVALDPIFIHQNRLPGWPLGWLTIPVPQYEEAAPRDCLAGRSQRTWHPVKRHRATTQNKRRQKAA